ncbi:MAG TPA: hypothetical protein VHU83_03005 [Bryobacteraceae bacterium]|nr:hypothetical protein [Bryobacteraceae bacterium]
MRIDPQGVARPNAAIGVFRQIYAGYVGDLSSPFFNSREDLNFEIPPRYSGESSAKKAPEKGWYPWLLGGVNAQNSLHIGI